MYYTGIDNFKILDEAKALVFGYPPPVVRLSNRCTQSQTTFPKDVPAGAIFTE